MADKEDERVEAWPTRKRSKMRPDIRMLIVEDDGVPILSSHV